MDSKQNIIKKTKQEVVKMENNIKSPSHYKIPGLGIESIDIIRHTVDNFKKARVYLDWLIEEVEKNE